VKRNPMTRNRVAGLFALVVLLANGRSLGAQTCKVCAEQRPPA
jgi:hypothetical protein